MKNLTAYLEDIKELDAKANGVKAKCELENRDPLPEEVSYMDSLYADIEEIEKICATIRRGERIHAKLSTPETVATQPSPQTSRITVQDRPQDRFSSFGEQLASIINAGQPGGRVDPRLMNAASGYSESVPSDGGFLVQKDFSTRLFENLFDNGLIASRCQKIPISGNSNGIVLNGYDETSRASTTHGGITIYWADEAGEKTASKGKYRRVELSLKKMVGLCYLTDELMLDASALEASVSNSFRQAFDFKLQDSIINGTGAGQPLGILNSGCLVSVPKETGQVAATLTTENLVKMYARRFASQTNNYAWYYNQNIEPQLFTMSLAVGTGGGPVYMPPGGLSDAPYGRIMGLPAYAIEQCAALGTVGDIVLANFPDGYILAEKGGMTSDVSIHVRFVYDETALRFVLRVDGQPWRASALTPYKGSDTQSHFIALASRA